MEFPNLDIHKLSLPGFTRSHTYTITVDQTVGLPSAVADDAPTIDPVTQTIKIAGTALELNQQLVQSVYPAEGQADQWFTLPHVVFANAQVPWSASPMGSTVSTTDPYMALVVFQDSELNYDSTFLTYLQTAINTTASFSISATKAIQMTYTQYLTYTGETMDAEVPVGDAQVIFLTDDVWSSCFANGQQPGLFAHVRKTDDNNQAAVSVVVSSRTGPANITAPTTVRAHLVALSGVPVQSRNRRALVSLYSWSYTCLPTQHFDFTDTFRNLGMSCQPLRLQTSQLDSYIETGADRIADRAWAGYSPLRYIPSSGETLVTLYRGLLAPIFVAATPQFSNKGSDLAILDSQLGVLDLTYQIAWELGRSLAISNQNISASILRLRGAVHQASLSAAKHSLDAQASSPAYRTLSYTLGGLGGTVGALANNASMTLAPSLAARWSQSPPVDTRKALAFNYQSDPTVFPVFEYYISTLQSMQDDVKAAVAAQGSKLALLGDNPVAIAPGSSSDCAAVVQWLTDKFLLRDIPWQNLMSDSVGFLPPESIRTFYIDSGWMEAFMDGAISIGEHFTIDDDVRACIKTCMTAFQGQIPQWGFFIRSQLIVNYPTISVLAPRPASASSSSDDSQSDCLRAEAIDKDIYVAIFDRLPNQQPSQFPDGIWICPPAHHLRFQLGDPSTWSFNATNGQATAVTVNWRSFSGSGKTFSPPSGQESKQYTFATPGEMIYDATSANVLPDQLVQDILTILSPSESTATSSMLATQLLGTTPVLHIHDGTESPDTATSLSIRGPKTGDSMTPQKVIAITPTESKAPPRTPSLKSSTPAKSKLSTAVGDGPFSGASYPDLVIPTYPDIPSPQGEPLDPFWGQIAKTNFDNVAQISKFLVFDDTPAAVGQNPSTYFSVRAYNAQSLLDPVTLQAATSQASAQLLTNNPKLQHLFMVGNDTVRVPTDLRIDFTPVPPPQGTVDASTWYAANTINSLVVVIAVNFYAPFTSIPGPRAMLRPNPDPGKPETILPRPGGSGPPYMASTEDFWPTPKYPTAPYGFPKAEMVGPAKAYFSITNQYQSFSDTSSPGVGTYTVTLTPRIPDLPTGCVPGFGPITMALRDIYLNMDSQYDRSTGACSYPFTYTETVNTTTTTTTVNANVFNAFLTLGSTDLPSVSVAKQPFE